jgi:hypothetical protein
VLRDPFIANLQQQQHWENVCLVLFESANETQNGANFAPKILGRPNNP